MATPYPLPGDLTVTPGARPRMLAGRPDRSFVLLIHGFTGFNRDLLALGEALNSAGHTVMLPRLPGHGTGNLDFRKTGWRDWLRHTVDAYLDLRVQAGVQNIVVGGLSMGGLLATLLASQFPVSGLMLYAPAFRVSNPLVRLSPALRWLVPPLRVPTPEHYEDPERQYMADQYWNWQWPAQVASLYRLMRLAGAALPGIQVPTLTVVSDADRTVPPSVLDLVRQRARRADHTGLRLTESGHVVTDGVERERVISASLEWMEGR